MDHLDPTLNQRLEISGLLGNNEEDSNYQQEYFQKDEELESKRFNSSPTYIDDASKLGSQNERGIVSTNNTRISVKPRRQNYGVVTNDLNKMET